MNESYGTRSLREIMRILFEHWILLFLVVVIGGAGTYFVCEHLVPRYYRSEISLIFKRPMNKNPITTDQAGERTLEVFVKAQQQIVMSDLVLARALAISGSKPLRDEWYALRGRWEAAKKEGDGHAARIQDEINRWLQGKVGDQVNTLFTQRQQELRKFRESVKLQTPGGEQVAMTESFSIRVDRMAPPGSTDPQAHLLAHYAADVLADMYIVRYLQLQQDLNAPAERVMDDVVESFLKQDVDTASRRYQDFIVANADKIGVLEQLLKSGTEHGVQVVLTKIRENDATLHLELARDRAIFETLSRILPAGVLEIGGLAELTDEEIATAISVVAMDFFRENLLFLELSKSLTALENRRARIEAQFTPDSRDVQYIREEVARNRRRLMEAVVGYVAGLRASIEAREQQRAINDELVKKTAAEQNEIHSKLAEYARLKNEFEVAQKHLEKLQQERIEAKSAKLISREAVTVSKLDEASVPDVNRPIIPMTGIYTTVAVLVSLLLGIAFAFLADHFDHSLRSSVEAERYLGVPVLGSVRRRGRRLIVFT